MSKLSDDIQAELSRNNGKLSVDFINLQAERATTTYLHPTPNMRLCIIHLPETGHEVLGVAQVLDVANDVEAIGNNVAYDRAVNELWSVFGNIAKAL